jgi:hypothetical protein
MTATSTDFQCIKFVWHTFKVSYGPPYYVIFNTKYDTENLHNSPLYFDLYTIAICLATVYGLRMAVYNACNQLQ